jgi:hypothetical protein
VDEPIGEILISDLVKNCFIHASPEVVEQDLRGCRKWISVASANQASAEHLWMVSDPLDETGPRGKAEVQPRPGTEHQTEPLFLILPPQVSDGLGVAAKELKASRVGLDAHA